MLYIISIGDNMSIKKTAIKIATKKIIKSKKARKTIKAGAATTLLLGGAFAAYTLALEGKKLEEKKEEN